MRQRLANVDLHSSIHTNKSLHNASASESSLLMFADVAFPAPPSVFYCRWRTGWSDVEVA